jgi:hypothetical protein
MYIYYTLLNIKFVVFVKFRLNAASLLAIVKLQHILSEIFRFIYKLNPFRSHMPDINSLLAISVKLEH